MQNNVKTSPKGQLPEKKIRAGAIAATIWKNQLQKGTETVEYFSVALDRNYKDKEGVWKSTGSLRIGDLPKAVLVLNKAYEFLILKEPKVPSGDGDSHSKGSQKCEDLGDNDIIVEDIY